MIDKPKTKIEQKRENFSRRVGRKEERKLEAKRQPENSLWYGLGMMGMVAWSIVIPTILGGILGLWLNRRYHVGVFFSLLLIGLGLGIGCLNAWRWVMREEGKMRKKNNGS